MPGTTPKGFPYPLPTEPLKDGADAIKNLATALDSAWAGELGYAQRTTNLVTAGAYLDSGMSVTFTAVAGQIYMAEVYWPSGSGLTGNSWASQLWIDGAAAGLLFLMAAPGTADVGPVQRA